MNEIVEASVKNEEREKGDQWRLARRETDTRR